MIIDESLSKEIRLRHLTLALVGFCAFLSLNMTQPLLPMLRTLFHETAGAVSMTVGGLIIMQAAALVPYCSAFSGNGAAGQPVLPSLLRWRYSLQP
jgi:hypothetical protein